MKVLAALIVLTASTFAASAKADVIECSFTEPFVTTTYSMAQQSLTITNYMTDSGKPESKVIQNVSFQIKGAANFELVGKDKKVIQKITLSGNGSDGMSEKVFPYSVEYAGHTQLFGGCESNFLKGNNENGQGE